MTGLFVYIALCLDDTYYTGVTNNVERTIEEHNNGNDANAYTYFRRPIKLIWQNKFNSNTEAINWEKKIKGWNRKKKEALMRGEFELLPYLAECKNETSHKNYKKQ